MAKKDTLFKGQCQNKDQKDLFPKSALRLEVRIKS